MTLIIRNENEKHYLYVLKHLLEQGDEEEIKNYILNFNHDDPDYDSFIQKLQKHAKNDNIEIIEEMIFDEDLVIFSKQRNFENFDDEEYENYLYTGYHDDEDPLEEIPNSEETDDNPENLDDQSNNFI